MVLLWQGQTKVSNLYYDATSEQATLDGISISIVGSVLKGGRRLHIPELFKKNNYVATDMGVKSQIFTINFVLYKEKDSSDFFDRATRMRNALNSGKELLFVHPNYGKLTVMAGEYVVSDIYNKLTFEVSLTIVPPLRPVLGLDHVQNILRKATEVVVVAKKALIDIKKEVDHLERDIDDISKAIKPFVEKFEHLKAIITNPSVITKRLKSFEKDLSKLDDDTVDGFLVGLKLKGEDETDTIVVPPGNITETFSRMESGAGTGNNEVAGVGAKNNDVVAIFDTLVGVVMVQELVEATEKTIKDLDKASSFLIDIEHKVRGFLPLDCLDAFRSMRLAFNQMIVDDIFGVANQKIIKPQELPLIVSYYKARKKNSDPLEGFYDLNIFNQNIDYFFGEENQELVIET